MESHRLAARREKSQAGGFTGLHQLTLRDSQKHTKQWDINDPSAIIVCKKFGKAVGSGTASMARAVPLFEDWIKLV